MILSTEIENKLCKYLSIKCKSIKAGRKQNINFLFIRSHNIVTNPQYSVTFLTIQEKNLQNQVDVDFNKCSSIIIKPQEFGLLGSYLGRWVKQENNHFELNHPTC